MSYYGGCCNRDREGTPVSCPVLKVSPEDIDTRIIIWSEQVIFRNIHVCTHTCIHAIIINGLEVINLK